MSQKGRLTAKQRAGHRGGVPDGFHETRCVIRNAVLRTVYYRCQLRFEHLVGSHVHIGNSAIKPKGRSRHGEPARCYGGPSGLPGAGHRANSWNERRLARTLRTSYLSCHSTATAASSLSGISKVRIIIIAMKNVCF